MARNGVASRWRRAEKLDGWDLSLSDSDEVHVLAVDDSLVDRKVIERLLRITSCRVTAVDSGLRALQFLGLDEEKKKSSVAFNGLKVDLIITDYCMPGMTGYELLKKIKESSTFKEIPVVIMSSENVLARIDRCLEEGAEDFLVKPVKLADVKRLRSCLTKEAKMRNNVSGNKRKIPEPSDQSPTQSPPSVTSPPSCISSPSSPSPSPLRSPLSSSLSAPSSPMSVSSSPISASSSPISASSSPSPILIDSSTRRLNTTNADEISSS